MDTLLNKTDGSDMFDYWFKEKINDMKQWK